MSTFDVVIVGGGLGGLISGAKLAREGFNVCLIEQHSIPGGCATGFKRKGYTIEVGLHEIDGLHEEDSKTPIFKDLGILDNLNFIEVPDFYHVSNSTTEFVMPSNIEEAKKELIARFPHEEKGIKRFFRTLSKIRKELSLYPQKGFANLLRKWTAFPFFFTNLIIHSRSTVGSYINRVFHDEELKLILLGNLQYYHDDPATMSLLFFGAAQISYMTGGAHFIQGGSQKLSNYLADQITQNGGTIHYNHQVTRIIVEDGHTQGVFMAPVKGEGEILVKARRVIANAALPTVPALLPDEYRLPLEEKLEKFEPACSILTVYVCMKESTKKLGNNYYSSIIYDDSCVRVDQMYANAQGDYQKRNYVLLDYSLIDSQLNPDDKPVSVICMIDYLDEWKDLDEASYKARKKDLAESLFDRIETKFPGYKENIVYYEVGTARTIERYTLNPAGTPYGYAQTPSQAMNKRLGNRSDIPGLYFASAWIMPGGGFSGAIIGGWLCATMILDELRKEK